MKKLNVILKGIETDIWYNSLDFNYSEYGAKKIFYTLATPTDIKSVNRLDIKSIYIFHKYLHI